MSLPTAHKIVRTLQKTPALLEEVRDLLNAPPPRPDPPEGYPPVPSNIDMTPAEWDAECDRQGMGKQICHCGFRWCGSGSCM